MNDSAIIRTISKVHSAIIDLLIFIFVAFFSIYFTLHIGLKLENIILPGIQIEQLYIKWDEKIAVNIESVKITKSNKGDISSIKTPDPKKILEVAHMLDTLFSEVNVARIQYGDINATFRYKDNQAAHIEAMGPSLDLVADIAIKGHLLLVNIKGSRLASDGSSMNGRILVDTNEARLYGSLKLNAAAVMPLDLFFLADQHKVKMWGRGSEPFTKSIKPAVRIANLHPKVEPWVADYHQGKAINLEYFKGTLVYRDPISLLDTLDAKVRYDKVQYTFAPGYEPAIAEYTDVLFKDRVLYIYPREATFYGEPGQKTWLKIDFTDPSNVILSVDVDTDARLVKEMLPWLKGYGIKLPFYQTAGKTRVKLGIDVGLNNIDVTAKGSFKTDLATFNFSNTDINVTDVHVDLHNTDIDIKTLNAGLLDNAVNADLSGRLNPVKGEGTFDITLNRLKFTSGANRFEVAPGDEKLKFSYLISPQKDRLYIPKSYWRFNERPLMVNPVTIPFDFLTLSGTLPTTLVSSEDFLKSYITGQFSLKKMQCNFIADLLSLKTTSLSLEQSSLPVELKYQDGLYINIKKRSDWKVGNGMFTLYPSILSYKNSLLYVQDAHFAFGTYIDTYLSGSYSSEQSSGKFKLKKLQARAGKELFLTTRRDIGLTLAKVDNSYYAKVPALGIDYQQDEAGWEMSVNDLGNIAKRSPLLSEYNITKGSFHLHSASNSDAIDINGTVPFPYGILIKANQPMKTIDFNGRYSDEKLELVLNKDLVATLANNRLKIKTEDIGFSLPAIFDFYKDHPASDNNGTKTRFRAEVEARNSYLYLNAFRRAPADKILLQYKGGNLNAQLLHGDKGGIALEYTDKNFFIYGDRLNDIFMNGLAEFSDFKGGELSFYLLGTPEEFEGVVQVKNTIVKDYKIMNNVFAFLNTIPALVTFSIPHYNIKGLTVNEAYGGFSVKDDVMTIKGFHVTAPELAFNGKGTVDLSHKTLDVETSLVTEAGSNLSKIPLLGYILVGEEDNKATTTINISGPLNDPTVSNTLAKDIVIAPFNIVKRALTFPVHYIDKAQAAIEEAEKK